MRQYYVEGAQIMQGRRKTRIGRVVSDKMDKTAVVVLETRKLNPLYRKIVRRFKKFKAHDENNDCRLGDMVKITECRPLSKEKRWRVTEIITRGDVAEIHPRDIE